MASSQIALPADKAEHNNLAASGQAPTDTTSLQDFGPFAELVRFINMMITLPGHDQNTIEELLHTIMAVITTMAMVVSKRNVEQAPPNSTASSPGLNPAHHYSDRNDLHAKGGASTMRGPNFLGTIKDCVIDAGQDAAGRDQFYGGILYGKEPQQEAHSSGDGGCTPPAVSGGCFGNIIGGKVNTRQRVAGRDQYFPQEHRSMMV